MSPRNAVAGIVPSRVSALRQGFFTLTDAWPDVDAHRSSWERGCPARKWDGKTAADRCGRDTSVPRTPVSGAAPIRPNRVPPHEPIPRREKALPLWSSFGVIGRSWYGLSGRIHSSPCHCCINRS